MKEKLDLRVDFLDNEEIVGLLIVNGININHKNSDLKSALHTAVERGDSSYKTINKMSKLYKCKYCKIIFFEQVI